MKLLLLKVELDFLIILLICSSYFVLNMSSVGTVLILKIPDSKFLDFSRLSWALMVCQTTNKGQRAQRRISPDPEEFWATELIKGDLVANALWRIRARQCMGWAELQGAGLGHWDRYCLYIISTGAWARPGSAHCPAPLSPSNLSCEAFLGDCFICYSCWCLDTLFYRIQAVLISYNCRVVRW